MVAYCSRSLKPHEQKYSTIQREFLGVLYSLGQFRKFIYLLPITLIVDHNPLVGLLHVKDPTSRLHRWCLRLAEYDIKKILHRKGKLHSDVDSLSRMVPNLCEGNEDKFFHTNFNPEEEELQLNFPVFLAIVDLSDLQKDDEYCQSVINNKEQMKNFEIIGDVLLRKTKQGNKIVVPRLLRPRLLQEAHGGPFTAHTGFYSSLQRIKTHYWFPDMKRKLHKHIESCESCQHIKRPYRAPVGLLQPIEIPDEPASMWSVDITGPKENPSGVNKYIHVAVDLMSKYCVARAMPDTSAKSACIFIMEDIICKFSFPQMILTDRGGCYKSGLYANLLNQFGIKALYTSGYRPQTNGSVERFNQTIKIAIDTYLYHCPADSWEKYLQLCIYGINTAVKEKTKHSPFRNYVRTQT